MTQVTPGTKTITNPAKPSSSGGTYSQTTHYDEFGRRTARTDRTNHGYGNKSDSNYHSDPHHHQYDPKTQEQLRNTDGKKNFPGEY